jgi:fibro-slime domain-containing protein
MSKSVFTIAGLVALSCSAGGPAGGDSVRADGEAAPLQPRPTSTISGLVGPSDTGGQLFEDQDLAPGDECDGELPVVYRDFSEVHPDFEMEFSGDVVRRQLVAAELGADRKPVFLSSVGCPAQQGTPTGCADWTPDRPVITNSASFDQWYRNVDGVNVPIAGTLVLTETPADSGLYIFNSTNFFPIGNDQGFGVTPQGQGRNFLFTTEIHLDFAYNAGQRFTFRGDDDLWIFVNGRLAMDLGSMHGAENGTIDFDAQAAELGITPGASYPMDIFHAERHTTGSNFGFETNIACFSASIVR